MVEHTKPHRVWHVLLPMQVEFKKWCPAFKLLTYFGSAKERKAKRQGWSKPNAFHVAITSYTLILQAGLLLLCDACDVAAKGDCGTDIVCAE